jgi:ribulose-5-phosphate 4-epimerase/fuculose-1-phosphate aldolase
VLRIKRSGLRLRELGAKEDLVPLPLAAVQELFLSGVPDADDRLERLAPTGAGAPSVEAFFHAMLGPWTAHAHLVSATAVASIEGDPSPRVTVARRLGKVLGVFCDWVPYAPPGSALAREVHARLPSPAPPRGMLLLQNHGAIVWGPTPGDVLERFERLDMICRWELDAQGPPGPAAALVPGDFDPDGTPIFGELGPRELVALRAPWTPDAALHFGHGLDAPLESLPALGRLFLRDGVLRYACANAAVLENAVEIVNAQLTAQRWTRGFQTLLAPAHIDALLRWGAGKYGIGR